MTNKITIDGKDYESDKLPPEAVAHIAGLQFCDLELQRLQMSIATVQTSRAAYANALQSVLQNVPSTAAANQSHFASDTVKFN